MASTPDPKYDLTQTISPFLDLHMMFPILEFLKQKKLYIDADLDNATKELLDKTSLSEYALSHLKLAGKDKENWDNKKKQNDEKLAEYSKVVDIKSHTSHTIISTLIENNSEILDKLVQDKTLSVMDNLKLQYSADLGCLSEAMRRSRFFYDIGKYDKSSKYLKYIVYILPPNLNDEIFKDKGCKSLWGLLCSLILNHNYNEAIEPFLQLRDTIDGRLRNPNPKQILQERLYLLHWGLFLYFTTKNNEQNLFSELCLNINNNNNNNNNNSTTPKDEYISALQSSAPWLLRYLTCAVMMEPKRYRTGHMKELAKVLKLEQDNYTDPITEFISSLLINVDFDKAQNTLAKCEDVVANDFFFNLQPDFVKVFMDSARSLMFETYCRIHQVLDLTMLAGKLNLSVEDAEKWIVELIRTSALNVDAKIDSEKSVVYLEKSAQTIYEQVYEKGRTLSDRTSLIVSNIARTHPATY